MPVRIEFKMVGKTEISLASYGEKGAFGILEQIVKDDQTLSEMLNAADEHSVTAALYVNASRKKNQAMIPAEKPFRLVFTALEDNLGDAMAGFITHALAHTTVFTISGSEALVLPLEETYGFIEKIGYNQILMVVQPENDQGIEFLSPAVFESSFWHAIMPDPEKIYAGLMEQWNRYCDSESRIDILPHIPFIKIKRYNIHTKVLDLGGYRQTGFTGNIVFDMSDYPDEVRKSFAVLTSFTWFAGIGVKCRMGLGQSKPMPVESIANQEKSES